jgi:nucleotide-binding universal stress UspA family protein
VIMVFSRIAVPTDGTEASLRGLEIAMQMAARYRAELMIITAVPVPDWIARQRVEQGAIEAYVEASAQKSLRMAIGVLQREGIGAEVKVVAGAAPESIVAELDTSGADLVVMGRRGRDEPKDLVLGSVSDRVARHVKVPILLVP